MKKNLNDYKKEMHELETRSHGIQDQEYSSVNHERVGKRQPRITPPISIKWAKLVPGLMAILMAILTLLFLIISHALNNR
jgi:hypothetical protein